MLAARSLGVVLLLLLWAGRAIVQPWPIRFVAWRFKGCQRLEATASLVSGPGGLLMMPEAAGVEPTVASNIPSKS